MKHLHLISMASGLLLACGQALAYAPAGTNPLEATESRIEQLHETTEIAEQIWNGLTNEFVSQYEAGNYTAAAATAKS